MPRFIIFLVGRDKSDPRTDFTRRQVEAAKELALAYERLNDAQLQRAIGNGILKEIRDGNKETSGR